MTRQNRIHKDLCEWEKGHKKLLKDMQRANPRSHRTRKNRKFFRQLDKDFEAKWRKENANSGIEEIGE